MKTLTEEQINLCKYVKALVFDNSNANWMTSKRALDYVKKVDKRVFNQKKFKVS